MAVPRSLFTWNRAAKRYRDASGRFVSRVAVRQGLDVALTATRAEMAAVSEALRIGGSLDVWIADMRVAIKDAALFSSAAARGGWAQMTPADFGRVGRFVRDQYAYLDRFAADIAAGYPLDGRFLSRARLYGHAGRALYHEIEGDEMESLGAVEEANVETVGAEHCKGPNSCPAETARGWVPLGELRPIGQRACLGNCLCHIAYRDANGDEV